MPPTVHERADVTAWDVASPQRPSRMAGVTVAGFGIGSLAAPVRLVPHPGLTLMLDFGVGKPIVGDAAGQQRQQGSLIAGLGFGFGGAVLARGDNLKCVQVRLSPVIARALLGVSPADLHNAIVGLDDLWGRDVSRIREQMAEVASWQERFALIDALLTSRRQAGAFVDPEIAWAWDRIVASRGRVRVDLLAAEVGWSRKRLWSRFRSQIGLQPKRAARLVRFDHAAHRLVAGQDAARVAADGGYADQSHLHRDIMTFTGVTPATVASEPFLAVDDIAWPSRQTPIQGRRL